MVQACAEGADDKAVARREWPSKRYRSGAAGLCSIVWTELLDAVRCGAHTLDIATDEVIGELR